MSRLDNNSRLAAVYIQLEQATNADAVLGFEHEATPDELRGAYRELVFLLHPDKCAEDLRAYHTELFQKVSEAFDKLTLGTNKKSKIRALPETSAALRARVWRFQQKRREEAEQKKVEDARLAALRPAKQAKYAREKTKHADAKTGAQVRAKVKMAKNEAGYQKQVARRTTKEARRVEYKPMEVVLSAANIAAPMADEGSTKDVLEPANVVRVREGLDDGSIKPPTSAPDETNQDSRAKPKIPAKPSKPLERRKLRNKPQTSVRLQKGKGKESLKALLLFNGGEEASHGARRLLQNYTKHEYLMYLDCYAYDNGEDTCVLLSGYE